MDNLFDYVLEKLKDPAREKSVKQIAEEADVPYFTVQKWMRAKQRTRNPRVDSVQKLADYFQQQRRAQRERPRAAS